MIDKEREWYEMEIRRLREENHESFDSMVDHHETEVQELKETIEGHEAAMRDFLVAIEEPENANFIQEVIDTAKEEFRAQLEKS